MSRNWHASGGGRGCESVDATLNELTRTNYYGQFRMEKFQGYGALPDILISAAQEAGALVLGNALKDVTRYGRPLTAYVGTPRRDTRDQGLGEVSIHFDLRAKLGWKWYNNIDRHLKAFDTIVKHMRARVAARYPEAECFMTHDHLGGYDFHVVVTPSMPYGMAA